MKATFNRQHADERSSDRFFIGSVTVLCAAAAPAFAQLRPPPFDVPWIAYETAVYPQGIYPWASRVADFNNDGAPDLATVSWSGTAYLSILFADGAGGYRPPVTYPLLDESLDLEVGDIDRDGDIDIAASDTGRFWEGGTISIWSNNGSGNFTRTRLLSAGSTGPSGLTAGDYNGDGWLDLATAHDEYIVSGHTIAVILSDGTGNFRAAQVYAINSGTRSITTANLDGDGDADLIVGHESNRWTFMRNNGAGTFSAASVHEGLPAGFFTEQPAVHVRDFDRDGDADVFYSNWDTGFGNGAVGFWRNIGGGVFAAPETISFNWPANGGVSIATADVTGDAWPDVVVATDSSDTWFLIPGNGSGGFAPARRFRAGQGLLSIQAPDLNGDQSPDVVVVGRESMAACVYLNPGDGSFIQPRPLDMTNPNLAPAFPTNLESGDIDGDGTLDLVVGFRADFAGTHGISVRRNLGGGNFGPIETYPTAGVYPTVVRLRDISGDGPMDVLWKDGNGLIRARNNNGDGTFGSIRTVMNAYIEGQFDLWDVDGDGDTDLVATGFFEIEVAMNRGDGTFAAPVTTVMNNFVNIVGMGDFNGDGILDLLTDTGAQGSACVAFGTGTGAFGAGFDVPAGRDVRAFATGDVDRNGVLDFSTIYNLDEKGMAIRRGRGNGDFHILQTYHGSYGWTDHTSSARFVDADGDGELDALTANFNPQDASIWRGTGGGEFDRLIHLGVGEQAFDADYGDFDGDGVGDLAVITQVNLGPWWYPGVVFLKGNSPRTGYGLVLSQTPLQRGQTATLMASGAQPEEDVHFLYSTRGTGAGICPPQLGGLCLDLLNPVNHIGAAEADASGVATFRAAIPGSAPVGATVHTQVVARRGPGGLTSVKSRTVSADIMP